MDYSIIVFRKLVIYTEEKEVYFYLISSTKINFRLMGYYKKQSFRTFRTYRRVFHDIEKNIF